MKFITSSLKTSRTLEPTLGNAHDHHHRQLKSHLIYHFVIASIESSHLHHQQIHLYLREMCVMKAAFE